MLKLGTILEPNQNSKVGKCTVKAFNDKETEGVVIRTYVIKSSLEIFFRLTESELKELFIWKKEYNK